MACYTAIYPARNLIDDDAYLEESLSSEWNPVYYSEITIHLGSVLSNCERIFSYIEHSHILDSP